MKRRTAWLALLAAAVAPGCASYYYGDVGSASGLQADLLQANQQAADALLQSARLDPRASVLVATLVNVDRLGESSRLGRLCSEQIAGRLVQRGVPVTEVRLREQLALQPAQGELLLSRELREIARSQNAAVVLVGTYSPASDYTYVSIKLVRTEDSRILRGHDYALPNDRDVQRLLQEPSFR